MESEVDRKLPNILLTGVPGTGKSTTAASVVVSFVCFGCDTMVFAFVRGKERKVG